MTSEQKARLEHALETAREIGRELQGLAARAYRVALTIQEVTSNLPVEDLATETQSHGGKANAS